MLQCVNGTDSAEVGDGVRPEVVARAHALYLNDKEGLDAEDVLGTAEGSRALTRLHEDLAQLPAGDCDGAEKVFPY